MLFLHNAAWYLTKDALRALFYNVICCSRASSTSPMPSGYG